MTYVKEKAREYLAACSRLPSLTTMTAQEARQMRAKFPMPDARPGKVASIENRMVCARDGYEIPVRIYTPAGEGPFPVILYYHGGGWVLNDLNTCHVSCSLLAQKAEAIVVSVEYRLAPEYKFPVPLFDAYDAFLAVKEGEVVRSDGCISVAGDSAGGNLATAVTQLAREDRLAIDAQILLYPVTDLSYDSTSYNVYGKGFGLDGDVMRWFGDYYIRSEEDVDNPLLSPLRAELAGLPRAFVLVAENDVLRDEGLAYAKKLEQSGVPVTQSIASGLIHSYFTRNDVFQEEILETIDEITAFLHRQ